jgi:hypothetical protein
MVRHALLSPLLLIAVATAVLFAEAQQPQQELPSPAAAVPRQRPQAASGGGFGSFLTGMCTEKKNRCRHFKQQN